MSNTNICNSKFVNFTTGNCRVTVIGEIVGGADNKLDIYSSLVSVPESGVSLPIGTTISQVREINDIFNSNNSYAGSTPGQEQVIKKNIKISLKDDYTYLADSMDDVAFNRNILINLLMNEKMQDKNGNYIKPAGTNGAIKRNKIVLKGYDFGKLFELQGRLLIPQSLSADNKAVTALNSKIKSSQSNFLTVMLEFLYEYDEDTAVGYRFVYAINRDLNLIEGNDSNTIDLRTSLLCDANFIKGYWIDGPSNEEKGIFHQGDTTYAIVSNVYAFPSEEDPITDLNLLTTSESLKNGDIGIAYDETPGMNAYMLFIHDGTNFIPVGNTINKINNELISDTHKNRYEIKEFDFTSSNFIGETPSRATESTLLLEDNTPLALQASQINYLLLES